MTLRVGVGWRTIDDVAAEALAKAGEEALICFRFSGSYSNETFGAYFKIFMPILSTEMSFTIASP
jgi:hypothetical protein